MMKRRSFLGSIAGAALLSSLRGGQEGLSISAGRLVAPPDESIRVAFVIGPEFQVMDFGGPWEVFQDTHLPDAWTRRGHPPMPFELYTVSEDVRPLRASGGLQVVPDFGFDHAPAPRIVVVPAQDYRDRGPGVMDWLRSAAEQAQVVMSVCNGAFILAQAGLLKGRPATSHHQSTANFARRHPEVDVRHGVRFVEGHKYSTAAGVASGIDLALRVVERYFDREVAQSTADYMEYRGEAWKRLA